MKVKLLIISIIIILNCRCINKKQLFSCADEMLIPVSIDNQWGFLKQDADYLVYPKFNEVMPFSEGVAAVCLNNKWGFIDTTGNYIIAPIYGEVTCFSEGKVFSTGEAGEFLCLNKQNDTLFTIFDAKSCKVFHKGYAEIATEDGIYYVDESGKTVNIDLSAVNEIDDQEPDYKNNLTVSKDKNGKFGYVNKKGKFKIKPIYEAAGEFRGNLAYVKMDGKTGFIDSKGRMVIEPRYDASYDDCKMVFILTKDTLRIEDFVSKFINNTTDGVFKGMSSSRTLSGFLQNDRYRQEGLALVLRNNTRLTPYARLIQTQYNFSSNITGINKKIKFNYEDGFDYTNDTLTTHYDNPEDVFLQGVEYWMKIDSQYTDQMKRIVKEFKLKMAEILTVSVTGDNEEYIVSGKNMRFHISIPIQNEDNSIHIKVDFLAKK